MHDLIALGFDVPNPCQMQPTSPEVDLPHICPDCSSRHSTAKQLGIHRFAAHGTISQERRFVQSTVCGGCLTDYRTTHRLQQHLRYRPNQCYDRLLATKLPDEPVVIGLPEHQEGLRRLPCIRRHSGPFRPTSPQHRRAMLFLEIWQCTHLLTTQVLLPIILTPERESHICALNRLITQTHDDCLAAIMIKVVDLCHGDSSEELTILALWLHGMHNESHMEISSQAQLATQELQEALPEVQTLQRILQLQLQRDLPDSVGTDRCSTPSVSTTLEPRLVRQTTWYAEMQQFEQTFLQHHSCPRPPDHQIPCPVSVPMTVVLHMYSGRRRQHDFHAWAQHFLQERNLGFATVISLDTAIAPDMDIYTDRVWNFLRGAAMTGCLAALLVGPPCETWSAARNNPLASSSHHGHGPRPLRHPGAPWGLPIRGWNEQEQIRVGSVLLLRAVWLILHVVARQGRIILEHPAQSDNPEAPSIWLTAIIQWIVRKEQLCNVTTIEQWLWAAPGIKPTSLMYAGMDLPLVLAAHKEDFRTRPTQALIGKDASGAFRTSAAKEYSACLSRAFADALCHRLPQSDPTMERFDWCSLASEFSLLSSRLTEAGFKPDYQPR